ncbi:MAG: EscU/YscU/HrcU family type III secretion system export apparatus switch protein, partial [Candidatus Helarchaeota archaeon]|nr:EscU/YscU/HrcU family type III secretion system export apparatus switch protein [Candidatus Helarchaeota archaeon]
WLLKEKINISSFINRENASEPLRINQHLSISIHLTSIDHQDLSNNLTLFTFLVTPSNRTLYMIFFHTQAGWYNALYPSQWLNETGSYFLVVYANSPSHTTVYAVQELTLESALPSGRDTSIDLAWFSEMRILIGFLIFLSITGVFVGLFLFQRWQWRRQMTIVELKEKLKRDISNALNEYHLFIKETEELLHTQVVDHDKLRLILDKQGRTKNLLKKLKKLGKHI